MKNYLLIILGLAISFGLVTMQSCTKVDPANPYDALGDPPDDDDNPLPNLDPNTIQGLHQNIFSPTCANSGCHDGSFEPDFRTVESSYNTLVNHTVVKNDSLSPYAARVVPGDPDGSMLIRRLTADLPNSSGIMPLIVDPGSDWIPNKVAYIANIRTWITNGAKDMFGN